MRRAASAPGPRWRTGPARTSACDAGPRITACSGWIIRAGALGAPSATRSNVGWPWPARSRPALEGARLRSEWVWDEDDEDDEARTPSPRRPGLVRDATFLNAVLPFALDQSRRHGEPVSLICVQLDRLLAIRDLLGPEIAESVVHDLGEAVVSMLRSSDLVARLDDDRIVALLIRAPGEDALRIAGSIWRTVAESGLGSPRLPGTTVSMGVAEFPAVARDAASLLDAADEAMAAARAAGLDEPVLAGRHRPTARPAPTSTPAQSRDRPSCRSR